MKLLWLLFGVFALTPCNGEEDSVSRLIVNTFVNCLNSDVSLCLKEHALKATERIGTLRALKITDQITLINNQSYKKSRSIEPLSTEIEVRRKQVSQRLWDSTSDLLRNSDLEYVFDDDDDDVEESRAIGDAEESRGKKKKEKKKKAKLLISLAILGKIKAIILVVGSLVVIAASLFKIALILKIAFIAKVLAILKALLAKKLSHKEETWIPHEEHHESHGGWEGAAPSGWSSSGGGGGWGRSSAQNLAYSAHKK